MVEALWTRTMRTTVAGAGIVFVLQAFAALAQGTDITAGTQVQNGAVIYQSKCAACHGAALQGGAGPALKPIASLTVLPGRQATAAGLANWVRLNMPVTDPGSLSAAKSYEVTAYILERNGRAPTGALSATTGASTYLREGAHR